MTGKQYFEGCPFRTSLFIVRAHVHAQAYTRMSFYLLSKIFLLSVHLDYCNLFCDNRLERRHAYFRPKVNTIVK